METKRSTGAQCRRDATADHQIRIFLNAATADNGSDQGLVVATGDRELQRIAQGCGTAIADTDTAKAVTDVLASGQGLGGRGAVVQAVAHDTTAQREARRAVAASLGISATAVAAAPAIAA